MYRQIAAETADDPSNIKTKGIVKCVHNKKGRPSARLIELHLRSKKEGGWNPVYQQRRGITTE